MKIVDKKNILLNQENMSKEEAIKKMISILDLEKDVKDKIYAEVLKREEIENTVIGFKFAIPHSKTTYLKEPNIVYLNFENDIFWAEDEENVKHVMLVLVPKNNPEMHIDILKNISKKLLDENFRKDLEEKNSLDKIYQILNN